MNCVNRVIDILEVFLKEGNGIRLQELSELSGLNVSTTYRIVSTLVERGYLNQHHKRGEYFLSLKLLQFGITIKKSFHIRDVAYPYLVELNRLTNEAANLAILDGNHALNIEHIESSYDLRYTSQTGAIIPLHNTAVGKVLLAYMREEELKQFLVENGLPRFTERTITDSNLLKDELASIRREEIAIDNEENTIGVTCIGSPIKDSTKMVIAAINISGPSARLNANKIREFKLLVKDYALKISREMGYRDD